MRRGIGGPRLIEPRPVTGRSWCRVCGHERPTYAVNGRVFCRVCDLWLLPAEKRPA